jgi:hypothetical protein
LGVVAEAIGKADIAFARVAARGVIAAGIVGTSYVGVIGGDEAVRIVALIGGDE